MARQPSHRQARPRADTAEPAGGASRTPPRLAAVSSTGGANPSRPEHHRESDRRSFSSRIHPRAAAHPCAARSTDDRPSHRGKSDHRTTHGRFARPRAGTSPQRSSGFHHGRTPYRPAPDRPTASFRTASARHHRAFDPSPCRAVRPRPKGSLPRSRPSSGPDRRSRSAPRCPRARSLSAAARA